MSRRNAKRRKHSRTNSRSSDRGGQNLEDVRYDIETERESLESMRDEKREAESALEELPDAPIGEIEELESELEQFREQKRYLESEVNGIQSVIGFNQEMLKDADAAVLDALEAPPEDVTEELLPDDIVNLLDLRQRGPRGADRDDRRSALGTQPIEARRGQRDRIQHRRTERGDQRTPRTAATEGGAGAWHRASRARHRTGGITDR